MGHEIRYNPNRFEAVDLPAGQGLPARRMLRQEVYERLDEDTWLCVELERDTGRYGQPTYAKSVVMRRELRPNGSWRSAQPIAQSMVILVEDRAAPASPAPAPPTGPKSPIAAEYIAKKYKGPPEPLVDIHELRRKLGMH